MPYDAIRNLNDIENKLAIVSFDYKHAHVIMDEKSSKYERKQRLLRRA